MKYQRKIIKFIFGMVLVCAIISPALALELGVDVLPGELQIVSTDPSEIFEIYVDDTENVQTNIFNEYIDPKNIPADRKWHDFEIPLTE